MTEMHIGPAGPTDDQIETQDGGPETNESGGNVEAPRREGNLMMTIADLEGQVTRLRVQMAEANAEAQVAERVLAGSIQPEWAMALPIQMQSVLLLSTRGADGVPKHHPSKGLIRMYRACVIKAAAPRRMLVPGDNVYDTFMDPRGLGHREWFEKAMSDYFSVVDELPFHYHLHLVHAAEILGYKHPDENVRNLWGVFYRTAVDDLHFNPETEEQLDQRLNDSGSIDPASIPSPGRWQPAHNHSPATACSLECRAYPEFLRREEEVEAPSLMEAPGEGYTDPSARHDHPSEAVCFEGCPGYTEMLAAKQEAILDQQKFVPSTEAAPGPVYLCGKKQGGANSPCIKPVGHAAPHNDGNYVW